MKKAIFGLIILSILTFSSNATGEKNNTKTSNTSESISVSGFVEDLTNSEKLVCAKIEIEELGETLFTDILGNYSIDDIEPGTYTLIVSYISYEELEIKEITVTNTKQLNIQLKPL